MDRRAIRLSTGRELKVVLKNETGKAGFGAQVQMNLLGIVSIILKTSEMVKLKNNRGRAQVYDLWKRETLWETVGLC